MKQIHGILILALLLWLTNGVSAAEQSKTSDVRVTIHDSHGLSAASARDHVLEVILFKPHTHIHFKISNASERGLTLWRPSCPEGDLAMSIEFREPAAPDRIFLSHTEKFYTGGSGVPKTFVLAPGDDLIVNVEFQYEWLLPLAMEAKQTLDLEMRAVYRSAPLTGEKLKRSAAPKNMEKLWTGEAVSDWSKVRVINRTGAAIVPKQ